MFLERLVEAEVEAVLPLQAHAVVEAEVRVRLSHDEQPEPSFGVHAVGGTSRATPRIAAAKAHAEPTLPAPTISTFMADLSEWTQPY